MKMHFVYILHSKKLNKYYVGETFDVQRRIERHNSGYYDNKYTARGKPWDLYLKIECKNKEQAQKIEQHIKKMKSKVYIENMSRYPEIAEKLLLKYKDC